MKNHIIKSVVSMTEEMNKAAAKHGYRVGLMAPNEHGHITIKLRPTDKLRAEWLMQMPMHELISVAEKDPKIAEWLSKHLSGIRALSLTKEPF